MRKRLVVCACAAAMCAGFAAASGSAQTFDQRTYFTFSGPVDIPGTGLQPGKYLFRIADANGDRSVVQVLSRDGKQVYAMLFTRPIERATAADQAEVRFMEAAAGAPPAVKTWWYPGNRTGREFVYPKEQARRIAERAHEPVLTTRQESKTARETDTADLVRVSPTGTEARVDYNALAEGNPSGVAQKGDSAPDSISTPVTTVARARTELPQTASAAPLVRLLGILMVAVAAGMRFRRASIA